MAQGCLKAKERNNSSRNTTVLKLIYFQDNDIIFPSLWLCQDKVIIILTLVSKWSKIMKRGNPCLNFVKRVSTVYTYLISKIYIGGKQNSYVFDLNFLYLNSEHLILWLYVCWKQCNSHPSKGLYENYIIHLWLLEPCGRSNHGGLWPRIWGPVTSMMLWPSATTNCGGLRSQNSVCDFKKSVS